MSARSIHFYLLGRTTAHRFGYLLFPRIQYLAWRVMVRLHNSVTVSFMLVGHTKFSPDWCFGLLKQCYKKTFVSCLKDIVDVNSSADVNTAQLASMQDGEVVVPTYDWAQFLGEHCRKVPQMKSYHHFSRDAPRVVALKKFSDSSSTTFRILADSS